MQPLKELWQLLVYAQAYLNQDGWLERTPEQELKRALEKIQAASPAAEGYSFVKQFQHADHNVQAPVQEDLAVVAAGEHINLSSWQELQERVSRLGFLALEPYAPQAKLMVILSYGGAEYPAAKEYVYRWLGAIDVLPEQVYISVVSRRTLQKDDVVQSNEEEQAIILNEVALMQPSVLLVCGRLALEIIIGLRQSVALSRLSSYSYGEAPVVVTYDPQTVLSFPLLRKQVWQDIQQLKKCLV